MPVCSLATAATGLALPLVVRELISTLGAVDDSVAGLVGLMTLLVLANAAIGAFGGYGLDAYDFHTSEAGGMRGSAMLGDEMIDEASRKMALVVSGKGRAAGMQRTSKFEIPAD